MLSKQNDIFPSPIIPLFSLTSDNNMIIFKKLSNLLENGETQKLIILKKQYPRAVLLSLEAYETMVEEIEDLRITALALERMQTFSSKKTISHQDILDMFVK